MLKICSSLSKTDLKILYFCQHSKKAKWPNHFISGKQFQKRPNGNPEKRSFCVCLLEVKNVLNILTFKWIFKLREIWISVSKIQTLKNWFYVFLERSSNQDKYKRMKQEETKKVKKKKGAKISPIIGTKISTCQL